MKVPLFKIYNDSDMVKAVSGVIMRGSQWCEGPTVKEFEQELAEYIGVKYAVCVNSGTSALHLALIACGIGTGDEVIVPSFTFIATANAALMVGAKPVFADIEEQTFGLDAEDVSRKITSKTKAIIPVHYGGCPCRDIDALEFIANNRDLKLIEDSAEALGVPVSTYGDASILSFCQNKIISTGEGGAVVTDSEDIANRVRMLRSHGRTNGYFEGKPTDYITLGYNYRMSDITAALGLSQLKKIDDLIYKRQNAAVMYETYLPKGVEASRDSFYNVFQLFTVRFESQEQRDRVKSHLTENGIGCKVYFEPVHKTHFYQASKLYRCDLPVTEKVSSEVLSLPIWPGISQEEIETVCKVIKEAL